MERWNSQKISQKTFYEAPATTKINLTCASRRLTFTSTLWSCIWKTRRFNCAPSTFPSTTTAITWASSQLAPRWTSALIGALWATTSAGITSMRRTRCSLRKPKRLVMPDSKSFIVLEKHSLTGWGKRRTKWTGRCSNHSAIQSKTGPTFLLRISLFGLLDHGAQLLLAKYKIHTPNYARGSELILTRRLHNKHALCIRALWPLRIWRSWSNSPM